MVHVSHSHVQEHLKEIKTTHLRDLLKDVHRCESMIKYVFSLHQVSDLELNYLENMLTMVLHLHQILLLVWVTAILEPT